MYFNNHLFGRIICLPFKHFLLRDVNFQVSSFLLRFSFFNLASVTLLFVCLYVIVTSNLYIGQNLEHKTLSLVLPHSCYKASMNRWCEQNPWPKFTCTGKDVDNCWHLTNDYGGTRLKKRKLKVSLYVNELKFIYFWI